MSSAPPRRAFHVSPSYLILHPSAFYLVAIGCLGIAGQLVLLRELMAAYGGNEFSAGVTVAAWMLCEAFGAWLAGLRPSFIAHYSSLITLSVLASIAAVPAATLARPLLGVLPGESLSILLLLLVTFAIVFLPAAAHGGLFVTAAAVHAQCAPGRTSNAALRATGIGSAYVWEGIGTTLTGVACFLLLDRLPSLAVVALSSLPLIVATRLASGRSRTRWTMWILGPGVLASLVFALPIERMVWGAAWRGQRVTAVTNSAYGKVVELERAGQQLILYDGLPVLTVPTTHTERVEELALLPVLFHPAPRRVLVLGHDLAIPATLARFRPDIEVATVQIDPILARVSLAALSADSSHLSRLFSLTIADPVAFLETTRDTFDCIILTDATPSSLGSSRLFSLEFYQLCRSRLASGGAIAIPGPGNPTGLSPDVAGVLAMRLRTLAIAFEHVLPVAADFPLLLASDRPLNVATETLLSRLARLPELPMLLDSGYFSSLLDPFRQEALGDALQPDVDGLDSAFGGWRSASATSTAAFPRELFLSMVRENRLVSPAFGALYSRVGDLSPRLILLLGTALLIAGLVGARARGHQFSRGFTILTSGFSGAAASSLLIFAWQVRFGSVFSGIALLVAAFMLGTLLGAILGSRLPSPIHHSSFIIHRFLMTDVVLAACAAAVLGLTRVGPAWVFLLTDCLAGACLGLQFAVAGFIAPRSSLIASAPESAARRAGALTALDLAGGSLGGILTALVLVPVFGIAAAALVACAVKSTSALVQLMPALPGFRP